MYKTSKKSTSPLYSKEGSHRASKIAYSTAKNKEIAKDHRRDDLDECYERDAESSYGALKIDNSANFN